MTIQNLYHLYLKYPLICTDTRKASEGSLFFALKGESFDGNLFAAKAIEFGAEYAVIDDPAYQVSDKYILVPDVLTCLQELATYHRKQLKIPFIGITGSNGKTTTKELLNAVLSQKYKTHATLGNLNNHIGVPLTVLRIDEDVEIAIIEMGANHKEEITFLCSISQPDYGLITNVGKAHLEGFGGFEGVKQGKGELYDYLKSTGGTAFVNHGNPSLCEMVDGRKLSKVVYYGNGPKSTLKADIIENNPFLSIRWKWNNIDHQVKSYLTGTYNFENILAAITVGLHFGLSAEEINWGIESYLPGNNRSQITKTSTNTLICDYYNANPSSMMVALENFGAMDADKKVLILGGMFELGEESEREHLEVLKKAEAIAGTDRIYIGNDFFHIRTGFSGKFFKTTAEAAEYLNLNPITSSAVLIKGSRGIKLEQLLNYL